MNMSYGNGWTLASSMFLLFHVLSLFVPDAITPKFVCLVVWIYIRFLKPKCELQTPTKFMYWSPSGWWNLSACSSWVGLIFFSFTSLQIFIIVWCHQMAFGCIMPIIVEPKQLKPNTCWSWSWAMGLKTCDSSCFVLFYPVALSKTNNLHLTIYELKGDMFFEKRRFSCCRLFISLEYVWIRRSVELMKCALQEVPMNLMCSPSQPSSNPSNASILMLTPDHLQKTPQKTETWYFKIATLKRTIIFQTSILKFQSLVFGRF